MADSGDFEKPKAGSTHHELLIGLKSTIEGLLATHSTNVWNTYGGLNRVCNHVDQILRHRIRPAQSHFPSDSDYWDFVQGLKWLSPVLAPSIERLNKLSQTCEDSGKGITWLRDSLHDHMLSAQLEVLVRNTNHLHNFYYADAFLCSPAYFQATIICLKAVELNKVALLAEIEPSLLSARHRTRSHARSASLPINQAAITDEMKNRDRNGILASPFASPGKESVLSTSDEHAVPIHIGSSPDDTRLMAKEALRSVLKKSGAESPPLSSTPPTPGFSFYDRIHSDPLLNVDFTMNRGSLMSPVFFDSRTLPMYDTMDGFEKTVPRRCKSHGDDILKEPVVNGNSQTQSDIYIPSRKGGYTKSGKSASNSHDGDKGSKKDSSKLGHKRSRSDMSGIKHGANNHPMVFTNAIANDNSGSQSDSTLVDPSTLSSALPQQEKTQYTGYDLFPHVLRRLKTSGSSSRFDGRLHPPAQGQSLMSYLSSQDFHTCANLDKENAHFSISEALIAAIEQMKWNHVISPARKDSDIEEESDEEIQELKQRIRIRRRERQKEKARGFPAFSDGRTDTTATSSPVSSPHDSSTYSDSYDSSDDVDDEEIELTLSGSAADHQSNLSVLKSSGLSLSMASLYSDADLHKSSHPLEKQNTSQDSIGATMSAESVAISLLKKFSEKQLPKASDLEWLVSEQDAPQALLPLPNSYPVSPDDGENADLMKNRKTRIRGNLEWAPPRPQIIFNIHPPPKRSVILAKQNYRCAGCGMKVEPAYVKRFRYCEYLGKYFCQCCHSNSVDYVPGRVLRKWDFTKYYVSNFAHDLLAKIFKDPLFNVVDINPLLFRRVRNLETIRDCRKQLFHLKSFLKVCKQGSRLLDDIEKLPRHWLDETTVFSMEDLTRVKSGDMVNQLKNCVHNAMSHILDCPFCQGLGFICELCNSHDIIFPFQLDKVFQCPDCHACYHKTCFIPGKCPKCSRIELRKQRLAAQSVSQDNYFSDDSGNDSTEPSGVKS
ncbi:run domain Beclin-1-interacting and cysteine-rich domain-containing protein-like isoform X1 [Haliotis asinina]|uniref:run domain Beclin-1-interacting and cysteine-rich domain-containing protein-like isoform X1 n=1 Tax=Haliotis asinina TaxID=109174 RepID=UPI003531E840